MCKSTIWEPIADKKVLHVWKLACDEPYCKKTIECTKVHPDWYQNNGTPICPCGTDMKYSHTEIERNINNVPRLGTESE